MEPTDALRSYLAANEIDYDEPQPGQFSFSLPGERKLQTPVRLDVGNHALAVHAFVCRKPDENHERVYRWLLERNLRMYGVAFAVDRLRGIFLHGPLPLAAGTPPELDPPPRPGLSYARAAVKTSP